LLQRVFGPGVELVTSGTAIARRVRLALAARDLATTNGGEGRYDFLCSGDADDFALVGSRFLQLPMGEVEHVDMPADLIPISAEVLV
jgi:glutamate racemase